MKKKARTYQDDIAGLVAMDDVESRPEEYGNLEAGFEEYSAPGNKLQPGGEKEGV